MRWRPTRNDGLWAANGAALVAFINPISGCTSDDYQISIKIDVPYSLDEAKDVAERCLCALHDELNATQPPQDPTPPRLRPAFPKRD